MKNILKVCMNNVEKISSQIKFSIKKLQVSRLQTSILLIYLYNLFIITESSFLKRHNLEIHFLIRSKININYFLRGCKIMLFSFIITLTYFSLCDQRCMSLPSLNAYANSGRKIFSFLFYNKKTETLQD